jgi:cytochrome c553
VHSLNAYKSGARKNAIMAGQVEKLSTRELEDLAAYYAAQHSTLHVIPLHRVAGGL